MNRAKFEEIKRLTYQLNISTMILHSELDEDDPDSVFSMMENIDEDYKELTSFIKELS